MELRPYQIKNINDVYQAWQQGAKNVIDVLPTGAGKTVIFSHIMANYPEPAIAIAHRMELVSQISLTLARYGIRHNIIAQKNTIREIISIHMHVLKRSYYDPQSRHVVAGVDTLLRLDPNTAWFKRIGLVVQDEGHHPLRENKWGRAANLFPNARGLYPTATPVRADGMGLGRHADGIIDEMVIGPSMRSLIEMGFLTKYRVFAPPSAIDLQGIPLSASGDYSPPKLRDAVHKAHITGDVVAHYLKFAQGKLGVTFAVDIQAASEIAAEFRANGVSAEVISSKTPDILRAKIMEQFRRREILQIVNVDILGEGVDVPAIEVVSMARPTQSFGLFSQNFGRALRPMEGKSHAIIIDHVNNVVRHGLPDAPRRWTLDRRDKRARATPDDVIPLRTCLNPVCVGVYPRTIRVCPNCGFYTPPVNRSSPEYVDGDLFELDESVLAKLRGEISRVDGAPPVPRGLDSAAQRGFIKHHFNRQRSQASLRETISQYAGYLKSEGKDDSEIYRQFYFMFGMDVMTAQTLNTRDAEQLTERINKVIDSMDNNR